MVHGKCRSAGCYAMTDALMEEIYGVTREALKAGQQNFQLHAYPFRMSDARMAQMKTHKWFPFWKTLKQGYDHFEAHRIPPGIAVCERRYVVNVVAQSKPDADGACPAFQRPIIAAFTPLPTELPTVATGNKLKGLVSSDVEPTLAEITAAKSGQSVSTVPAGAGTTLNPVATAR